MELQVGNVTAYTDGDAVSLYQGTTHGDDHNPDTGQYIEGVLPGFTYTYVVEAVNASGTSERTAQASILIPTPGKPDAVRDFEHGAIRRGNGTTTNIVLSWDAPPGFTTNSFGGNASYVIERAVDLAEHTERALDWEDLAAVSIGIHTYTDSAAVDATTTAGSCPSARPGATASAPGAAWTLASRVTTATSTPRYPCPQACRISSPMKSSMRAVRGTRQEEESTDSKS